MGGLAPQAENSMIGVRNSKKFLMPGLALVFAGLALGQQLSLPTQQNQDARKKLNYVRDSTVTTEVAAAGIRSNDSMIILLSY